eukprot:m.237298 g.237298  ORF g.237298 m.237298 type:complete len:74 (+) comp16056_c0_seq3:2182-2403(+)
MPIKPQERTTIGELERIEKDKHPCKGECKVRIELVEFCVSNLEQVVHFFFFFDFGRPPPEANSIACVSAWAEP